MTAELPVEIAGETLSVRADRTLFWPREATLFVADTHWGKDATFRALSIAIPEGSLQHDLGRLSAAIEATGARRLIVLGDLLHAKKGRSTSLLDGLNAWRAREDALEVLLVRGNHDQRAGDPPAAWRIRCVDAPLSLPPFVLHHIPAPSAAGYVLAGHLHPGVALRGRGRQRIDLPCFWFGAQVGVLPAFGSFTGHAAIAPQNKDRVFALADAEIIGL